jgi:pectinesterase
MLGRYHRDAQFFLVDCRFGANMKDADIYLVPTSNTIQWGRRIYYADCSKEDGINFAWHKNNLPANIEKQMITTGWLFGDKWHPEK